MIPTEAVTQVASVVWGSASNFLVVIILFGILFIFARYVGRGPFVALLIALYAAYALYSVFPYTSVLPTAPASVAFFAHVGLYAVFAFLFYVILRRVIISDFLYIGAFGLVVLSFLGAAFLLALATHAFSLASFYQFTPAIAALFSPDQYFFWWFSAPVVGLLVFAR